MVSLMVFISRAQNAGGGGGYGGERVVTDRLLSQGETAFLSLLIWDFSFKVVIPFFSGTGLWARFVFLLVQYVLRRPEVNTKGSKSKEMDRTVFLYNFQDFRLFCFSSQPS